MLGRRAGDPDAELLHEMLAHDAIEQQATFHAFDIDQLRARLAASSAPSTPGAAVSRDPRRDRQQQAARRELDLLADAGFAPAPRDPNGLVFIA